MKRVVTLILAVLLIVSLFSACGSKPESGSADNSAIADSGISTDESTITDDSADNISDETKADATTEGTSTADTIAAATSSAAAVAPSAAAVIPKASPKASLKLIASPAAGTTPKPSLKSTPKPSVKPSPSPVPVKYSGSITASGSSALYPLVNYAADLFKDKNPDLSITLNTGGSGTGLTQVSDGSVDIGNSDVFAAEKLTAEKANQLTDHKVCVIGVAIVVNPDVAAKVSNLSKSQLKDIFAGAVSNWKEVGGPDEEITIINRPSSSGTRALFKQWALDGNNDLDGDASLTTDDSGALAATISKVKGSIGYLALSYTKNATANIKTLNLDNVAPTYANIYNGSYPVWGYEHMYTKGEPKGAVKAFLNFMVSDELNKNFEPLGYGVISKMKVSRTL